MKTNNKGADQNKLVKLMDQEKQYEKAKSHFWQNVIRDENGAVLSEGNNWEYFNEIDKLHSSVMKKIDKLQTKWNWTDNDIEIIRNTQRSTVSGSAIKNSFCLVGYNTTTEVK